MGGIDAVFYIVVNKLGDDGDVVNHEILNLLQRARQSKNQTVRIIFTCTPRTIEYLGKRGLSCPNISISNENQKDVQKVIDAGMDNIEGLSELERPGVLELRAKVKDFLADRTGGDYFKIITALNEIRCSNDVDELDTILDNASKETNDHIQGEIDKLNQFRTSKELAEINEIILWVGNSQERLSVEKMTAALQLSTNSTALRSLDSKFKTSYSLFETNNDGFIEFRSSKFLELIPQRRQIVLGNTQSEKDIHPKEIEVVEHFLNTVCPPDLLQKLQIQQHFKRMTAIKSCQVCQEDDDTAHARITTDILRVVAMEEDAKLTVLQGYATCQLIQHLSKIDLALVDRDLKSQIGPGLVRLFTDSTCIDNLFRVASPKPGLPNWILEDSS